MPTYPLACTKAKCGHQFDATAINEKHRDEIRCPKCRSKTKLEWSRMTFKTDRVFPLHKRKTIHVQFHPSEVQEVRRMLPTHNITDDGDVLYEDAGHMRRCDRELAGVEKQAAAIRAERAAREAEAPIPEPTVEVLDRDPDDD